ncbi:MAG: HYR domain-containing protein [Saprospiraceae bacterium]|nr:HYR domain-containing protein [Saprospiraceae bacterium]MDW8483050.1 HYR domain-containing protein [Saprospiraceae bacterium]
MRKTTPTIRVLTFASLPYLSTIYTIYITTMNNTSMRRWLRGAAVLLAFLFAGAGKLHAQPCSITWPGFPNPVPITITLDPLLGTATLDYNVVVGAGVTSSAPCTPVSNDHVRFYADSLKTAFFDPSNPAILYFDCSHTGAPMTIWVAINDGTSGDMSMNPFGESQAVRLKVTIIDNTLPVMKNPVPTALANTSDDGGGNCWIHDINTWSGQDIAINGELPNFCGFFPGVGCFEDNCPDSIDVTYELSGATTRAETPAPKVNPFPPLWDAGLDTFYVGTTTVTYRIYERGVFRFSTTTTVTVNDDEDPSIACPSSLSFTTDVGVCTRYIPNMVATHSDNCAVTQVTWSAPGASPALSPPTGINDTVTATFPLGTTTVTMEAKDAAGNTKTCSFTITVIDTEPPIITCPPSVTVAASGLPTCDYTVSGTGLDATANDNCPPVSSVLNNYNSSSTLNGAVFNLGSTAVVWTATDAAGNVKTCSFTLVVKDSLPPAGPTAPLPASQEIVVNVTPGDCSKSVTYEYPGLFFHNPPDCTPPVTLTEGPAVVNGVVDLTFLSSLPAFNPVSGRMAFLFGAAATLSFPVGETLIFYTWTDGAGNKEVDTVRVVVKEGQPPVAKCKPGILTLPLSASGTVTLTVSQVDNGSFDNCGLDTLMIDLTSFTCADLPGLHTVTLTAKDLSGNTATCTSTVDVVDNTPPIVLCPGSKTVTTNTGCTAVGVNNIDMNPGVAPLSPGQYSDNCPGATVSWQLTGATTGSGTGSVPLTQAFNLGVTTVTYTISDASGNNAVCNFSVSVADNTPPNWTGIGQAPGSTLSVNANFGGCVAQATWPEPTFADACTPPVTVSRTHAPGSFFPFGVTTVTYTAIDGKGNVHLHTFNVNVVDIQAPNAQCKNITVYLNNAGTVTVNPGQVNNFSTDNCFFFFTSPAANYDCTNLGPNSYTLQITDGSGNTATCVATVTVLDTIKPVANCSVIPTIDLDASGNFTLAATAVNNASTDNTSPLCNLSYAVSVDGGPFSSSFNFTCAWLGNRLITLRVTDAAGNTATCSQISLVRDVTPPVLTAPANVTIECDESMDPSYTGAPTGISDNCDPAPVLTLLADVTTPGSCANAYTITRTWRVQDASGNSSTASQTITVKDSEKPVFAVQNTIQIATNSPLFCDAPLTLQLTPDSVSDNCSAFSNLDIKYTIDYPTPSYGYVDVSIPTPGSSIPFPKWPIGTTYVTWIVTDACNNTASTSVAVVVNDAQGPRFTNGYDTLCGKTFVLPNTTGACSNLFTWARPNASLNHVTDCLSFTVSESISNPTVQSAINLTNPFNYNALLSFQIFPAAQFPVGITTVSYTATDAHGNKSTCSFSVHVQDTQAPTLTCPPNQNLVATCPSAAIPNYTNLVAVSDNCPSNVVLTQSIPAGTTLGTIFAPNPPAAGNQFTLVITGNDGYNTATCSFTVKLQDGQAPIPVLATLPNLIDSCGTLIVLAPKALDPCNPSADTIYGTPSTPVGTFLNTNPPSYQLNPGNYVLTWVYNDGNGNISTQPQNITVLNDVFPPKAICVPNLTVDLHPTTGKVPLSASMLNNGSFDFNNCGPLTFSIAPDTLTCANLGATTVTLIVRDHKGNTATCTSTVTVRDVTPPIIAGVPANITLEACDTLPAPPQLIASDNCAGTYPVMATQTSTQTPTGFQKYNYVVTRTWTTADASGNSVVVTQVITVKDTKKPQFTGAPDTVAVVTKANRTTCDDTVKINILPFLSDCATGADLTVTNNVVPSQGGNLNAVFPVGTSTVLFTATDISGNSQTKAVTVVLRDGTPPTAVCINGVSASLQPSGFVVVTTAQFNNNSYDNCVGPIDLKIQRLDKLPLQAPSSTLTYDCADADGKTQRPVKLFATDPAGNTSSCETYIIIQENVSPTITQCPSDKTVTCSDTLAPSVHGTPLFSDNCPGNLTVSYTDSLNADPDTTNIVCTLIRRIWKVSDLAGNIGTCVQTFSIVDTVAPVLSQYPPDQTVTCDQVPSSPITVTASDNCSSSVNVIFAQDTLAKALGPCGKYSYTLQNKYTATDQCGNKTTHTYNLTVLDNKAPTFPGLPDTIVVRSSNFANTNNCAIPVTLDISSFIVDCAPVSEMAITNNAPRGNGTTSASGNYEVGTYKVVFTAIDPCGNVGKDSVVLIVIDDSKPTVICNNSLVVSLGSNGTATLKPEDVDIGSTDNCGIDTMFLSKTTFNCTNLGNNSVTLTVVDKAGNTNVCTVNVQVSLGSGVGFTLTLSKTNETSFGAKDGTAKATASGGSGSFSYAWSNGENTPTLTGLNPGVYYVTVIDQSSGCERVDSVVIEPGPKLTITAGMKGGKQGATIQIPVKVDQFQSMLGMSFSMQVDNSLVGVISGATSTGALPGTPALNVIGNFLTVFWTAPGGVPVSLPNGTVIFNVNVQLGNAPVGSTSDLKFLGTPTAINFQKDSAGVMVFVAANLVPGSVKIDSAALPDLQVAGSIKTWWGGGISVPGVNVTLGGSVFATQTTGVSGTYSFNVPFGANTIVTPTKSVTSNFSAGINVGDLLAIQNHAASVLLLTNPYQWVAGDIDNDGTVGIVDYLLVQQLILGTVQHYSNGAPDWKFIPKNYVFPSPNPLVPTFPQTISNTALTASKLDDDFVAVRMGDVTGNAPVNNAQSPVQDRHGRAFVFRLEDRALRAGEVISVPFLAKDFVDYQAYQLTIAFDPTALELANIQPGVLPGLSMGNFGTVYVREGYLTHLWVGQMPPTLADDEILFTLTFRVREDRAALSDVLHPSSHITAAEAIDEAGNVVPVLFDFVKKTSSAGDPVTTETFALYQNQPNPFQEQTFIHFRLPQAESAELRIFSVEGRLIKTISGLFSAGHHTVQLQKSDIGAPGIYWYELRTATYRDSKKMLLLD